MVNKSANYQKMEERWGRGEPAVMDGGIGSELQQMGYPPADSARPRNFTWGTLALYDAPETVKTMHCRYVDAGADILLTDTFQFHRCVRMERDGDLAVPANTWHEKARLAVRVAREAATEGGRPDIAVAFCMMLQDSPKSEWNANRADGESGSKTWKEMVSHEYLRELAEALRAEPPDAFLVELAPPIPDELVFPHFETLIATGIPLWIAYRRAVGGPIGIFGQDEQKDGDLLGRAAQRFEQMGVSALLVHCLPPDKAHGVAPWLRTFTTLPLGVYPNNGRYDMYKWEWEHTTTPEELAEHARGYVAEGMNIVGGCCGVRPEHIAAIAKAVKPTPVA
ncbi:MAG: homocysteine S-methyltransferase family protein [Anaerolineales bacterium]